MGFLFQKKNEVDGEYLSPNVLLNLAKTGDVEARDHLIRTFTPFILRVAAKMSGRYIRLGEDDEVSISLMAFNEAIDCYNVDKKMSFLSFAETVIKRRLIDFFRKESNYRKVIPLSQYENDDDGESESAIRVIEARQSLKDYDHASESMNRQEEIAAYNNVLKDFGLSFSELVGISPRHEDARCRAIDVAKLIAENPDYITYLEQRKELPLKQLSEQVNISRKTLERQRKYIIAIALILIKNFHYLKEYLRK